MTAARTTAEPGPSRSLARFLPVVGPALAGIVLGLLGHRGGAVLAGALAVAAGILVAFGVDVHGAIGRGVHVLGRVLLAALNGVLFALLIVPAWAWQRIRHRGTLVPHHQPRGWQPVAPHPTSATSMAASDGPQAPARSFLGRLSWAFGCVILVLGVNYAVGWGWDRATQDDAPPAEDAAPAKPDTKATPDRRIDLPAMAAYPWREQYFEELQKTPGSYWPFTEYRPESYTSKYVNLDGWVRRSYQPPGDPSTRPTVWMFGGSAAFGEGQRDDHTIASELARLSEAAGIPITISNYGERGWTHFQEMVLYEQQVALLGPPDIALFFDGRNEVTTQSLVDEAVPNHTLSYTYANRLGQATVATKATAARVSEVNLRDAVWDAYEEHSALSKVVDFVRGRDDAPPLPTDGSAVAAEGTVLGDGFTKDQKTEADGTVFQYDPTPQDGIDAGKVYERGKALTLDISKRNGVDTLLFWQPIRYVLEADRKAREQLSDTTIDISDSLDDHQDTYIDTSHTNEEGARIVAERIWKDLEPEVRAWYDEQ